MSVNEKMTAIADAIRAKTGGTQKLTLDQMAEAIPQVYRIGSRAAAESFWGGLQNYGKRVNYKAAFFTAGKLDDWFYPVYDFLFNGSGAEMFRGATCSGDFDMAKRLEECGVTMDFTKCDNLQMAFAYLPVKGLPVINVSGIKNDYQINQAFVGCYNLEQLTLAGTLSVNGLNLSDCTKLSRASIESVIQTLSGVVSGLSVTLSKQAVDNAFFDMDGEGAIGSESLVWQLLIDTKPNWTITLV